MHSNHLPPRHDHYPPRHPSAHHYHCHHQHGITTTAITITTAILHAMPQTDFEPFPVAASRASDSAAPEAGHSSSYKDALLTAAVSTGIPPQAAGMSSLVPVPPPLYRRPPLALAPASNCPSLPSSPTTPRPDIPESSIPELPTLPPRPQHGLVRRAAVKAPVRTSAVPCYTPQGVYPASLTPSTVSVCQDRKT